VTKEFESFITKLKKEKKALKDKANPADKSDENKVSEMFCLQLLL